MTKREEMNKNYTVTRHFPTTTQFGAGQHRSRYAGNECLVFTQYAANKVRWFLHRAGGNEVGGLGLTDPNDPLKVIDFIVPKQETSAASVEFDAEGLADLFEDMADEGVQPAQFFRVWIHTHPGQHFNQPSMTDENTFRTVFGDHEYAIMFIADQGLHTFCRLRYNRKPACQAEIEVIIDNTEKCPADNPEEWEAEYTENVKENFKFSHFSHGFDYKTWGLPDQNKWDVDDQWQIRYEERHQTTTISDEAPQYLVPHKSLEQADKKKDEEEVEDEVEEVTDEFLALVTERATAEEVGIIINALKDIQEIKMQDEEYEEMRRQVTLYGEHQ